MGSPPPTTPPRDGLDVWKPPEEFDEYRLIRPLGRGGNGQVFLAHDTLLERAVAVKFIPALDSSALARFLNEARAAARVQHPNVVTLYRVGQLDERAYLVSEYTRGVSLDRLKKPLPWRKVLELALKLTRGLAAAHRRGVLHRDIKPGNAILTETGEVKLLDFGLAKLFDASSQVGGTAGERLARAAAQVDPQTLELPPESSRLSFSLNSPSSALVGTPYYMSPEAWRSEDHTARSDLYSLGAMLYELCAGKGPFRDVPVDELRVVVEARPAAPLSLVAPDVDPSFAAVVDRCLRRDPLERFPSADALLDALEALQAHGGAAHVPEGNPYRGLRPFEAEHRALFFGRRRDLAAVLERLRAEPFLLLTGDSGVGKSSLCAAGVLPHVQEGALEDGRKWAVLRLVPGRRPLAALATAAAPVLGEEEPRLAAELSAEPEAFVRKLRSRLGAQSGLLLYVDQLEELVTLAPPEDARRFAEVLAPLAAGIPGARLIGSARSDFLTRLAGLPRLGEALTRALYLVRPMGDEEVREAVVGPARVKGVGFESEALVRTLVDSTVAAGGGLPLLQFALAQLWEARDTQRAVITATALTALGGVAGALARHADGVIDSLPPEQRSAARLLLLRLVTDDGTRARRTEDELTGGDPRSRAALEAMVHGRLLVARDTEEGGTYEVAHEALLNGWGTLARWISDEAETREQRQRLEAAARDWERLGHARDALWGARQLLEVGALEESALGSRERRFLEASRLAVRRTQRLRRVAGVGFVLALALAASVVKLKAMMDRERAATSELRDASRLLAEASERAKAEDAARREAYRAFDTRDVPRGELLWTVALSEAEEVDRRYAVAAVPLERALTLGHERPDVHRTMSDFLYERALRAERFGRKDLRDLLAQRLELVDAGGERWRQWTAPAVVELELPPGARVAVSRYAVRPGGGFALEAVAVEEAPSGYGRLELQAGSYLLSLSAPGLEPVRYPVLLDRGERVRLKVPLPKLGAVPQGLAYVPPGRFLFGSAADEGIRKFFNTVPIHPMEIGAFLISRHETTWGEWLAFLESLPPKERAKRTPSAGGFYGAIQLRSLPNGRWKLGLAPNGKLLSAVSGDKLRYPGRKLRADVDWLKLPVSGISFDDARAYAAWLKETGRLPGARLCTEMEWERAARGADAREFPHGNQLAPDDANFDLTYEKDPLGFGPDEVGSHPASDSPFGVHDLVGNVWEWTESSLAEGKPVARGSSYYFGSNACRTSNRESPEPTFRDLTVGMRICADVAW